MAVRLLAGVSASPGLAAGEARHVGVLPEVPSERIGAARRESELEAARRSLALAAEDLEGMAQRLKKAGRGEDAEIIATGALMAADPELDAEVARLVLTEGSPAASALLAATAQFADSIATLSDPLLAERADDVRSLGRRAARHALGVVEAPPAEQGVVVLAESLGPADVAELGPEVVAIALSAGGSRAHAAVVARSLGIPMVVGAGAELLGWSSSALVVVDGDNGQVRLDPDQGELAAAGQVQYHHFRDFRAGIASGSFLTAGMVVCPCSMGTASAIAHEGTSVALDTTKNVRDASTPSSFPSGSSTGHATRGSPEGRDGGPAAY